MQNPTPIKSTNSQKSKTKSRINKRQRIRRRNKQKTLNCNQNKTPSHYPFPINPASSSGQRDGAEIWRKAYENAIRWHGEHQKNYWRRAAENLQKENHMLRQQLEVNSVAKPGPDMYYETSDDDQNDEKNMLSAGKEKSEKEEDEIDVEYLEFLQITFKHREELRLKRQTEAQECLDTPALAQTSLLD